MRSLSILSTAFDILWFWQRLVGFCSSLGAPDVRVEFVYRAWSSQAGYPLAPRYTWRLEFIRHHFEGWGITAELCEELLGDSVELSSQVLRGRWSLHVYFNGQVCIVATP